MRFFKIFPVLALLACVMVSCGEDDENAETWRIANEQAFNDIVKNPEYTELKSPGNNGSIYYKILQQGNGTQQIFYTDTVEVYYKGWFVVENEELSITKGYVFDQRLFDDGIPFTTSVAGVIEGWTIALEYMVEGDKWEVWIPSNLAYGTSGSGLIPANSTLVFDIELLKKVN